MMRRWYVLLFVVLALGLAACGGDDSGNENGEGGNDNGASSESEDNTGQPQSTLFLAPTLPPARAATATFTPQPSPTEVEAPPTNASNTSNNTGVTADSELCASFRPDTVRNQASESIQAGSEVTIYWFSIQADNISYVIQLYDSNAFSIYSDEITTVEHTFDASLFSRNIGSVYYWQVIPYQNGSPLEACVPLDGEIFVNTNAGQESASTADSTDASPQ